MEELLHQLIGGLSHYLQGVLHPRWCRISSINSRNKHVYIYIYKLLRKRPSIFSGRFVGDFTQHSCFFFLGFLEGVAGLKLSQDPPDGWLQLFPKIPYRLEWQSTVNEVMLPVSS